MAKPQGPYEPFDGKERFAQLVESTAIAAGLTNTAGRPDIYELSGRALGSRSTLYNNITTRTGPSLDTLIALAVFSGRSLAEWAASTMPEEEAAALLAAENAPETVFSPEEMRIARLVHEHAPTLREKARVLRLLEAYFEPQGLPAGDVTGDNQELDA